MPYGKFTGCSCCDVDVCAPKPAGGNGEVSLESWSFYHEDALPGESGSEGGTEPEATWIAELVIGTTTAGLYSFRWEKAFDRTFHIPTVAGRSPDWWHYDKIYFATAATVVFAPEDLVSLGHGPGGTPVVEDDANDVAFRAAFGGRSPWEVGLTMFPITSSIPDPTPGEVQYPSAFSTDYGIPPPTAPTIEDNIETSWANTWPWFDNYFGNDAGNSPFDWGLGYFLGGFNWPVWFHRYTNHPRGWTYLPNGLGPLDEPLNQFGALTTPAGSTRWNYTWLGTCYPCRINAFIAPIQATLDGAHWHESEEFWNTSTANPIMMGLNDTYDLEWWGDGDSLIEWRGRNEYWIMRAWIGTFGGPVLWTYLTADEATTTFIHTLSLQVHALFGYYGTFINIAFWQGSSAEVPVTDVKTLPGVSSHVEGENTVLCLTDPAAYLAAVKGMLTWSVVNYNPENTWVMNDMTVDINTD